VHDLHGRADDVHRAARRGEDLRAAPDAEVGAVRRGGAAGAGARAVRRGLRHRGARGLRADRDLAGGDLQPGRLPAQAGHRRQADLGRRGRGGPGRGGRAIELLPTGELGEIVIRGHNVFKGYLNKPEATAAAIVDGWFRSGDLGTKDADGYVSIVDRKKDMVLRGGYNVYPREVEEVLLRHPAVGQVAVFGLPDPEYGEEVCAAVVLDPAGGELSEAELSGWAKERLAAFKYPRRVFFTDGFPLGPSGKVLKRELQQQFKE
jgi:acyl-CoA synthetase (AMP-forming)/AMP-acid ligase II